MTFLRSSDVKNHLYTGSRTKHFLTSEEIHPHLAAETAPEPSLGFILPSKAHSATAASAATELPSREATAEPNGNGNALHLVHKSKRAA